MRELSRKINGAIKIYKRVFPAQTLLKELHRRFIAVETGDDVSEDLPPAFREKRKQLERY